MTPQLYAWFDTDFSSIYSKLVEEYKQLPDTYKIWNFSVQWYPSDGTSPTDVEISWDSDEIDYGTVQLYDVGNNVTIDMLNDTSYSFTCPALVYQQFQIICNDTNNQPPNTPNNPNPENSSTDVSTDAILNWTGGDPDSEDTVCYDIYLDTSSPPSKVVDNQVDTTYNTTLVEGATYYWQIRACDNHGYTTEGPIWSFTTQTSGNGGGGGSPPPPSNGQPSTENEPPIANANGPYLGYVNDSILFNGSKSNDSDGTIESYEWGFGDNSTGTGVNPIHNYTQVGNYTITLTVTDNDGENDTDNSYVIVQEKQTDISSNDNENKTYIYKIGYFIDNENDGIYDSFFSNITGDKTKFELQDDGVYLIDDDGDDDWNYYYNVSTKILSEYHITKDKSDKDTSTPGFEIIVMLLAIFIILFLKKKRSY